MGVKQSTTCSIYAEAVKYGLKSLRSGVNLDQASNLWKLYDADGNGELSSEELQRLVTDIAQASIEENEEKVKAVRQYLQAPETIREVLRLLDLTQDGTVTKDEFLVKAMRGLSLTSPRLTGFNMTIRLSDLSATGVMTIAEAEKLWTTYAGDRGTRFGEKEVQKLLNDLIHKSTSEFAHNIDFLKRSIEDPECVSHVKNAFDLNNDGTITKREFLVTVSEGYELPLEPPAKRARVSEDNRWTIEEAVELTEQEVAALPSLSDTVTVLDKSMVDELNKAVEALNRDIIHCPEGFCVVYSKPRDQHYLLSQPDAKEKALSIFRTPPPAVPSSGSWSTGNSFQLSDSWPSPVENTPFFMKSVTSVQKAVEGLQAGLLKRAENFCVVLSKSQKCYFALYRGGHRDEALAKFSAA